MLNCLENANMNDAKSKKKCTLRVIDKATHATFEVQPKSSKGFPVDE